jgi:hypothetical protein
MSLDQPRCKGCELLLGSISVQHRPRAVKQRGVSTFRNRSKYKDITRVV